MVIFLIKFYDARKMFHKIVEVTHSRIFCSQMYKQNLTIKQLNYDILPIYIYTIFIF